MKGIVSRLAVMFWAGYMGLVIGSVLSRVSFDLFGLAVFILGLVFGSLAVLLIGWTLALLINAIFGEAEGFVLDFIWITLTYWFGFFVGMFFRVV